MLCHHISSGKFADERKTFCSDDTEAVMLSAGQVISSNQSDCSVSFHSYNQHNSMDMGIIVYML